MTDRFIKFRSNAVFRIYAENRPMVECIGNLRDGVFVTSYAWGQPESNIAFWTEVMESRHEWHVPWVEVVPCGCLKHEGRFVIHA